MRAALLALLVVPQFAHTEPFIDGFAQARKEVEGRMDFSFPDGLSAETIEDFRNSPNVLSSASGAYRVFVELKYAERRIVIINTVLLFGGHNTFGVYTPSGYDTGSETKTSAFIRAA